VSSSAAAQLRTQQGTFGAKRLRAVGAFEAMAEETVRAIKPLGTTRWPNPRWENDPVAFVREVLLDEPTEQQIEFLEAVRDHSHIAFRSGHKVGKSRTLAWIALWWFCTRVNARVRMTSTIESQVEDILWREIRVILSSRERRARAAGVQFYPLDCVPAQKSDTGLVAPDFREMKGFSARDPEGAAGISSENILYICDEASGITDALFQAFEGNLAGGGKIVLTSNPTRCNGKFFECFKPKNEVSNGGLWKTLHAKSTDTPNARSGRVLIPGMATAGWIEARAVEWGVDSEDFKVRVLGEFPVNNEKRILSLHEVLESQKRWSDTPEAGPLRIGFDVAGQGKDFATLIAIRGLRMVRLYRWKKTTKEDCLVHLRGAVAELRHEGEYEPVVACIDAEGFGWPTYEHLAAYAIEHPREFNPIAVHGGHRAQREPGRFERVRDELFACAQQWVRAGGAMIADDKLSQEAHVAEWISQVNGRVKATSKDDMKKVLGRSPDAWDAMCLACWGNDTGAELAEETRARAEQEQREREIMSARRPALDPYAGLKAWQRR
jgi:phage terminase large subunit